MKATYGEITHERTGWLPTQSPEALEPASWSEVEAREIFKDPITDDGTKKSKKGLLAVFKNYIRDGSGRYDGLYVQDQRTWKQEAEGLLQTVFKNGVLVKRTTLNEIRERLK